MTEQITIPADLAEEAVNAFGATGMLDQLERMNAALDQSAQQGQGEPVAVVKVWHVDPWYASSPSEAGRHISVNFLGGHGDSLEDGAKLYTHADPAEVERLSRDLHAAKVALEARARTFDTLRAQLAEAREERNKIGDRYDESERKLAEAQTLLRELAEDFMFASSYYREKARALLSASAEPSAPCVTPTGQACPGDGVNKCKKCPSAPVEFDGYGDRGPLKARNALERKKSAPVEIDERATFEGCGSRFNFTENYNLSCGEQSPFGPEPALCPSCLERKP